MTKTITIITPSFNQRQFIEQTIKSVLSQKGDFFIDYIIAEGDILAWINSDDYYAPDIFNHINQICKKNASIPNKKLAEKAKNHENVQIKITRVKNLHKNIQNLLKNQ